MKFNTSFLKAAAALTLCAASTSIIASPAEAALLSGSVDLEPLNPPTVTSTLIDFNGAVVNNATGSFASLEGEEATIEDLTLTPPTTVIGAIPSFIDFGEVTLEGETGFLTFDLASATINTIVSTPIAELLFAGDLTGTFQFGGESAGIGILTAQRLGPSRGFTINILAAEEIPTPALLPGVLGLGLGIVRKRKQQHKLAD